jgi:beta-phosphoglucomutase-like phosphatase (HAD superfamily)
VAGSEAPGGAAAGRPQERIRALLYDFDDTIVQSERLNDALFHDFIQTGFGIDLTREEQDSLYGLSWGGVFAWLRESRGINRRRDEVWDGFVEKKRAYLRGARLRVASGFDRMVALPVPQAIVSGSTRPEIDMMLANVGIRADAVDFIVSEEDCAAGKPDPEGFLTALRRLGALPGEALVFEDSPVGIEAAKRAGIAVAFVAELASRDSGRLADMRFESFVDAWEWVRTRIAGA